MKWIDSQHLVQVPPRVEAPVRPLDRHSSNEQEVASAIATGAGNVQGDGSRAMGGQCDGAQQ